MKLSEYKHLMVGDIVLAEAFWYDETGLVCRKEWHPLRVKTVMDRILPFCYTDTLGEWLDDCDAEDVGDTKEMPLTDEILEANGFVKDGYTNLSPDYRLEVRDGDYKGYSIFVNLHTTCDKRAVFGGYDLQDIEQREIICYGGRNIHKWYVHELQRALRSINLFDLADNFKIQ